MNILVVGGAGYIGSHMVKRLHLEGCTVTTLDNLSSGHADAVRYGQFVHADLADSQALNEILGKGFDTSMQLGQSDAFNLGNGQGFSVQEVIDASGRVTQGKIPVQDGERRAGDPARLVADATRARTQLNWTPVYEDLDTIIQHAWAWEQGEANR
jgi:UDP-glucose 4-epimerase